MHTFKRYIVACIFGLLGSQLSCVEPPGPGQPTEGIADNRERFRQSTLPGNLITTALKDVHGLDVAFFPSEFLNPEVFGILSHPMTPEEVEARLMPLYYFSSKQKVFRVGTMKGKAIMDFVAYRNLNRHRLDLQVAGLKFSVKSYGGTASAFNIELEDGRPIERDTLYKVAISDFLYGPPDRFPGYKYANGIDRTFRWEKEVQADEALRAYLANRETIPDFSRVRASFDYVDFSGEPLKVSIAQIQGEGHVSPFLARRVMTTGIVTAVGSPEDGGTAFYIQSAIGDGNPRTSEGLYGFIEGTNEALNVGHELKVVGTVFEEMGREGLGRTALRNIQSLELLGTDRDLPDAIFLGPSHNLLPPTEAISTYHGNVNKKEKLNLQDGLDFWESLEGMRIGLERPIVAGVSGGRDDLYSTRPKGYLNIFVGVSGSTSSGRFVAVPEKDDFNPEIIRITDHIFSNVVDTKYTFNVGDQFTHDLTGIFGYDLNPFGGGEYAFFVTDQFSSTSEITDPADRGITPLVSTENSVTIANFNVENLSARDDERLQQVADVIRVNLSCPDIVNLVEIQDDDGDFDLGGDADASGTLEGIVQRISCENQSYQMINIDPLNHREGGKPGGNIRVAMLYKMGKLELSRRGQGTSLGETVISPEGRLTPNPGRVYPNDPAFRNTRKALVVEFTFQGEPLYVIGNHFISKGGDDPLFGSLQPPVRHTEDRRSNIANRINKFVSRIVRIKPEARIVVLGDFNEFYSEKPMQILKGSVLKNLIEDCPQVERYTYNFGGNSQALDYIFVSNALYQNYAPDLDILHLNTDFMGQVSDHDPMIARLQFGDAPAEVKPCGHR